MTRTIEREFGEVRIGSALFIAMAFRGGGGVACKITHGGRLHGSKGAEGTRATIKSHRDSGPLDHDICTHNQTNHVALVLERVMSSLRFAEPVRSARRQSAGVD